ncbi:uncharacterized protein LOC114747178 [Neltuma alba]|uniref:uncharacterized protein LOC114747178 n=1 Tax=Neltuma alba TaxID=207710 RepID=UPI0010A3B34F|nr:uncharacterized protein LOC114747178 [Prosopis alba]
MAEQDTISKAKTGNGRFAEQLEVRKLLKKLNEPAIKSIKSHDGDIIDCVHILNQPAFDHPKLKNHKIQVRPTFLPKGRRLTESKPIAQMWHHSGSCPERTVPIRRTTKEDILRPSGSFQQHGKKDNKSIPNLETPRRIVRKGVRRDWNFFSEGGRRVLQEEKFDTVHSKETGPHLLLLFFGLDWFNDTDNAESIEAGWQIHPMLYGDDKPRLFAYWTSDSYEHTGCYNLKCPGFVQVSNTVLMGATLQPLSDDGGSQYGISILIWKDPRSGNWWMRFGDTDVGYWPASMFDRLSESVSIIQWGGEVMNKKSEGKHTTTEMGSGYFARAGFGRASFFKDISIVNEENYFVTPKYFSTFAGKPMCYDIVLSDYSDDWGANFYYGGPGRNPFCQT